MPFLKEKQKVFKLHKADWEVFQQKLDREVKIVDFDGKNLQQLEDPTSSWIKAIKDAMNIAIPKSNQYIFQLKATPEIKNLESQYKTLTEFATHFGWIPQTY